MAKQTRPDPSSIAHERPEIEIERKDEGEQEASEQEKKEGEDEVNVRRKTTDL